MKTAIFATFSFLFCLGFAKADVCIAPGHATCTITCPKGCGALYVEPEGPCKTICDKPSTTGSESGPVQVDVKQVSKDVLNQLIKNVPIYRRPARSGGGSAYTEPVVIELGDRCGDNGRTVIAKNRDDRPATGVVCRRGHSSADNGYTIRRTFLPVALAANEAGKIIGCTREGGESSDFSMVWSDNSTSHTPSNMLDAGDNLVLVASGSSGGTLENHHSTKLIWIEYRNNSGEIIWRDIAASDGMAFSNSWSVDSAHWANPYESPVSCE